MTEQENDARNTKDFYDHRKYVLKLIAASLQRERGMKNKRKKS